MHEVATSLSEPSRTAPAAPNLGAVWISALPTDTEIASARRRLHRKAVVIGALFAVSYYALVISDLSVVIRFAAAAVLVLALVAVGTSIMHDANHGSFSRHRSVNRALAYTSDLLGASSWFWRTQHNVLHHGNTNVVGFDGDIELAPWARLAPTQPWRPRFRLQHIYIWPLYGFISLKNLLVSDFSTIRSNRIGQQPMREPVTASVTARVIAGKLAHVGWAIVVPLLFNPWWAVLAFYFVCSWTVGFMLAIIFQLAHCVDIAEVATSEAPRRGVDFAPHQMATTVDIDAPMPVVGHLFRWVVGGLDHQIEHHLSPRLPHTVYPIVAARLRAACTEQGIVYRVHPGLWQALCSHTRWLRTMGARPATA
jgi:linoleoyl-CoA desaturase